MDELPQKKTRTPSVIRNLIKDLVSIEFSGNVQLAAKEISRVARQRDAGKRDYRDITASILYAIMSDKSHVKFSHLEMIAYYIGIPVGALLFITRFQASLRDGNEGDLEYLKSVHSLLGELFETREVHFEKIKVIGTGNAQLDMFPD